mgnify:CR=1
MAETNLTNEPKENRITCVNCPNDGYFSVVAYYGPNVYNNQPEYRITCINCRLLIMVAPMHKVVNVNGQEDI